MNSMWKRSFALLLSLVMVFGMVPVNAFAEEAEHSHSYETTVTDPTCTVAGFTTYTCACGDSYTADEVAATGHSYQATVTAPTCGEAGFTTYTCACGDTYTADEVAATGHSYADGVCSVCGAEEPAAEEQNEEEDDEIVEEETEEDEIVEEEPVVCDGTENCAAETHETTCECYDWCAALGCTEEAHHADCPWGPCTLTEGCELVKGHPGECTGAAVFAPVAKIGETGYATFEEAVAAAVSGGMITLLEDVTLSEEVGIPGGVTLNGNGYQINGSIYAGGDLTIAGETKVTGFSASYYNHVITIGEGASLEVTGTGRVSLAYGSVFKITGTVADAKTADKSAIQPSLVIPAGISITGGNGATMNVTNAYIRIGDTSTKPGVANGTFDLTFNNVIAEFTKQLTFSEPTGGMNPTFNVNIKDSVLTTGTKLMIAAPNTNVVIDNSTVPLGTYFRNSGNLTLKNGSKLTGQTIQFGDNGGNDGTTIVDNSELTIMGGSAPHAVDGKGTGVVKLRNGAKVNIDYVKNLSIQIEGLGHFTGTNLNNSTITIDAATLPEGTENASIVTLPDATTLNALAAGNYGKFVHAVVSDNTLKMSKEETFAKIGDEPYLTLEAAIGAAKDNDIIVLTKDVTLTNKVDINKAITLDLNGHKISTDQKNMFYLFADTTIKNGTLSNTKEAGRCVNTREAVELKLENVTLKATGTGNTQPVTLGTATSGTTKVTITGSTIDAGASGYSIISFVKCNVDVTNSNLTGHGNIYLKEGSAVNVSGSSVLTASAVNDGSDFGSIVFENSNNSAVTVASAASINAGEYAVIFSRNGNGAYQNTVNLNGAVSAASGIVKNYVQGTSTVTTTNASVKTALEEEGYALTETNGVYTISGLKAEETKPTVNGTVTGATDVNPDVVTEITQDIQNNTNIKDVQTNLTAEENAESVNNAAEKAVEKIEAENPGATVIVTKIDTTVSISQPKVESQATIEVNGEDVTVPREMTFDVTPVAITTVTVNKDGASTQKSLPAEPVENLAKPVTFRLPVSSKVPVGTMANVYHKGVPVGIHEVKGDNKGHYIEVTSQDFSPFKVSLLLGNEKAVASFDGNQFVTVQDAIDAATAAGGGTITLIKSTSEDFRINQTEGVNITVTAAEGVVYSGTIKIDGKARYTGTETVTISGITFSTTEKDHYFIDGAWINGEPYNYAHNVTVENCHFQGTGADSGVVGIKGRQIYGLEVIGCTADGVACFIDSLNTNKNLDISDCEVTNAQIAIKIQGERSVNITNCELSAAEYGIRFGQDTDNNVVTISGSTIDSDVPIHVCGNGESSQLKIDAAASTLIPAAGNTAITFADASSTDGEKIEVSLPSNAAAPASSVAKIGNTYYNDISVAVAAWEANGGTMTLLADVDNMNVEISKTAVLDRNGHKVGNIGTTSFTVVANGNLTLKDSNPTIIGGVSNALIGNVTVNGGTFTLESGGLSCGDKVLTVVDGFAEIKGGDLLASGANTTAISVTGGELKISGGEVVGQDYSIQQTGNGKVMICGGKIYDPMSGNGILIPGLVDGKLNTARFYRFDPISYCEERYASYKYEENSYKIVPAAASVTNGNVTTYYPTVADAVKATDNGETLKIITDTKDADKDVGVTKNSTMTIAADGNGGVKITVNVPADSKYVQIPVKGVTYRVGAYGDLTISKNGVVGGDNVPIKDGKPDYTLKPLNSEASYLSGSNATLTFESNMIFATFTKAYIDGTEIVLDKDYVATPGSTVITLANARLRTLTAGKHTLMIKDDSNNTVSCDFHVTVNASADTTNPKTGDEIFVPMFVMFSTAAALAVLVMGKKKHF